MIDAKDIKTSDNIKIKYTYKGIPFEWTGKIIADPIGGNYQKIEIEFGSVKCVEQITNINLAVPFCYDGNQGKEIINGENEVNNKAILSISNKIAQLKSSYDNTVLKKVYLTDSSVNNASALGWNNSIKYTTALFNNWKLDSQASPSYLADGATHEYGHLYDLAEGGFLFMLSDYNPDWENIINSLSEEDKNDYVRDCVYTLPTVTCGMLGTSKVKNEAGHPALDNAEYFASTFLDVNNYEPAYLNKANTMPDDNKKKALQKGAELIKSYKK